MSNPWIISSSESENDDDLPSYSHILFSRKNCGSFSTLSERITEVNNLKQDELEIVTERLIPSSSDIEVQNHAQQSRLVEKENYPQVPSCSGLNKINKTKSKNSQTLNIFKPEDCLQGLSCLISSSVLRLLNNDNIAESLQAISSAAYKVFDFDHAIIKWLYNEEIAEHPNWDKNKYKSCNQIVFVLEAKAFRKANFGGRQSLILHEKLSEFLTSVNTDDFSLIIACLGLKKYNMAMQRKKQKEYKQSVLQQKNNLKSNDMMPHVEDIENFFVDLHISHGANVVPVENNSELVMLLSQITKAIAETPLKKKQRDNLQFINENASVKINSSTGQGSTAAWKQMLEQLFSVSSDISSTIVSHYPSFNSLMKAYQSYSMDKASLLLSDVVIRRGFGSLQQTRRLGPELSKRIHKLLTCENGHEVV